MSMGTSQLYPTARGIFVAIDRSVVLYIKRYSKGLRTKWGRRAMRFVCFAKEHANAVSLQSCWFLGQATVRNQGAR